MIAAAGTQDLYFATKAIQIRGERHPLTATGHVEQPHPAGTSSRDVAVRQRSGEPGQQLHRAHRGSRVNVRRRCCKVV